MTVIPKTLKANEKLIQVNPYNLSKHRAWMRKVWQIARRLNPDAPATALSAATQEMFRQAKRSEGANA